MKYLEQSQFTNRLQIFFYFIMNCRLKFLAPRHSNHGPYVKSILLMEKQQKVILKPGGPHKIWPWAPAPLCPLRRPWLRLLESHSTNWIFYKPLIIQQFSEKKKESILQKFLFQRKLPSDTGSSSGPSTPLSDKADFMTCPKTHKQVCCQN